MGARAVDVRITGNNASLKRAIRESESMTMSLGRSMGKLGGIARTTGLAIGSIGAVGAYVAVKGLKSALDSAGEFQQKLSVLKAVSNGTTAEMKLASAAAIKLGADIRLPTTTAQGAADAMLELAKGGLKMRAAIGAAHATLLLSTAAQIDNAGAAKAVVNAMATFGLTAKDATKIVDDFAGAANASTADIGDVTDALQFAGQGFHALKVPVGDATTAIAEMANAGQKGGVAGAALNVAFTKLAAPTIRAQNLMDQLGIKVFDSNGKFVGIRGAIANLSPILAKMSQQQRLATLAVLGGTRGMRALNIVLGGGLPLWDKTHKAVTRTGQAQQLANAQTSGFKGAMAGLHSALETLELQIGLKLLPTATRFVRWLSAELPVAVSAAGTAISWLEAEYDKHRAAIQAVLAMGMRLGRWLIGEIPTAVHVAQSAIAWLGAEYDKHRAQIHAAIDAAKKAWDEYGPKVKEVARKIIADVKTLAQDVAQVVDLIRQHWDTIWSVLGPIARAAMQIVKTTVVAALKIVQGVIDLFTDVLHGHWGKAWGDLKSIVSTALGAVASIIGSALRGIASAAYHLALNVGEEIAKGALKGVEGLPGKLAAALLPGGSGTKYLPGSNNGTQSPRTRPHAAGGAWVAGSYSAGDVHSVKVAGEEAILNPSQIDMVGRNRVMSVLAATGAPTIGSAFSTGKTPKPRGGAATESTHGGKSTVVILPYGTDALYRALAMDDQAIARTSASLDSTGSPLGVGSAAQYAKAVGDTNSLIGKLKKDIKSGKWRGKQKTELNGMLTQAYGTLQGYESAAASLMAAGAVDTGTGGGSPSDPGGISPDAQAQIDQLNRNLATQTYATGVANAALSTFGGSGDIGEGGYANAWGAAQGGPNIIIQTLHPGDPQTLAAIGDAATKGMALQSFVTSPRLAVNI